MALPWEACSALGTANGPHGVNGRVALVGRGSCTFAQKARNLTLSLPLNPTPTPNPTPNPNPNPDPDPDQARNVQAGGAVAMIVTNYADEIITLGAYSDSDVAAVTIPLVMVTGPDGSALQAAVEGGATVTLELQPQP